MGKDMEIEKRTVTVKIAAVILGIGRTSAFEAVRRGDIPHIRIGKRILIPIAALDKMLEGCHVTEVLAD